MAIEVIVDGEQQRMMAILCAHCNEVKMIPPRRGRPPKYCPACTKTPERVSILVVEEAEIQRDVQAQRANERIDNLEMMLRSRGTHLSQQQERW